MYLLCRLLVVPCVVADVVDAGFVVAVDPCRYFLCCVVCDAVVVLVVEMFVVTWV